MSSDPTVIEHMQDLMTTWNAAQDRRVIFLSCYAMMTHNMLVAIEQGEFQDAEWVTKLLHHFAGYYFKAVEAYDHQTRCSLVWQYTFDAANNPQTHVIQNLMLGVNAHITYDLVLALADVLQTEWHDLSNTKREQRYQDHCHVNTIIAATINRVQDQVIERYNPAMDVLDKLFGPVDEWVIARLIAEWREEVWRHTGKWLACASEAERTECRQRVENHAMQRARAIMGKRGIAGLLDLM